MSTSGVGGLGTQAIAQSSQGRSTPGLEAERRILEKKLSECINCDSAKTREGKAEIDELKAKLAVVNEKINAPAVTGGDSSLTADSGKSSAASSRSAIANSNSDEGGGQRDQARVSFRIGPEGGFIDTHA